MTSLKQKTMIMKADLIHSKLIERCKRNDKNAQFEIYKLYYKGMYNVSLRIVQNNKEAEDVMQESFLSAFNKLNTWSGDVSFGSWLKKIVVNKSLDYLKKRKIQLSELNENEPIIDEPNIDYAELVKVRIDKVKKVIAELSEKYRIVAVMFLFEGFTHDEISTILNISSETSRVRFKRAKEMILKSPEMKPIIEDYILN